MIMPNIGYGTNKKTRHQLPNGARPDAGEGAGRGGCGQGRVRVGKGAGREGCG